MNYYQALELKNEDGTGKGYFHFTCTNDDRTWPVGYCQENKHNPEKCHHATPEEASDCYRKYCREKQNGIMAGFPVPDDDGTTIIMTSSY